MRHLISLIYLTAPLLLNFAGFAQAPKATIDPIGIFVERGSTITLTAMATGSSPLGYQWFYQNREIIGARSAVFTLLDARVEQSGIYSVVVSNSEGTTQASSSVIIWKPATKPPFLQVSRMGERVHFRVLEVEPFGRYTLEQSIDSSNWETVFSMNSTTNELQITHPILPGARLFRLVSP